MAKGGLARQRFEEKKQRNRIIDQLNQLKDQGYSADQIRNAGSNAYQKLAGQAGPAAATPGGPAGRDGLIGTTPTMDTALPPGTQWWQRLPTAPGNPYAGATMDTAGRGRGTNRAADAPNLETPFTPGTLAAVQNQNQPATPWWQGVTDLFKRKDGPAYGGSYNPTQLNPNAPTPYVPQWLNGNSNINQYGGSGTTPYGPKLAPGTRGTRTVDPSTGIPDFPMLSDMGSGPTYSGSTWKKWRQRRGGGGSRWYDPPQTGYVRDDQSRGDYVQSPGLTNWSIG